MKNIRTLIQDIHHVVESNRDWFRKTVAKRLAGNLGRLGLQPGVEENAAAVLRLSQMGEKCPCHLWHSVHSPSLQEPLPASASIKFAYGDVIEAMMIELAKEAGHEVTGEQDVLYVDGVRGHRDCVIDGCVVDVKSANSLSFQKIKAGQLEEDIFLSSYLAQLDGYVVGSHDDPLVRVKDRGFILAVDKVLGHLTLYEHRVRPDFIRERIRSYSEIIKHSHAPKCECKTVEDGSTGNIKLDLKASYNPFKHLCAENRGERIRTFLYSGGPRYLTKVVRRPMNSNGPIIEVDALGQVVYN
jgi:hypothetical protein